mgnify:CR=1 FL=1
MESSNRHQSIASFFERYVSALKQEAPNNSGALSESINYTVNDNVISIEMMSYGEFLEEGINGTENNVGSIYSFKDKKPPISSIESYAKSIGANPFALQNSIFKNGIRPKTFIKDKLDSNLDTFADEYIEAYWEDYKTKEKQ